MKEQDAAHSLDKRVDAICEVCKFNDAIHYDNNKYFCCGCFAKELTRLRSELQQTSDNLLHCYGENKKLNTELQQKDEVIKKMLPLAHRAKSGLWANDPYCGYVDETIEMAKESLKKQS